MTENETLRLAQDAQLRSAQCQTTEEIFECGLIKFQKI